MKKKILIIGLFSPPINGCSIANDILIGNIRERKIAVDIINTSTQELNNKDLGKFSLKKVVNFLAVYLYLYKVIKSDIIYTTPGQTFLGVLKYSPFYFLSILFNKKYIIHVHGNYIGQEYMRLVGVKKRIFGFFLSKSAIGIVLSEQLRDNFSSLLEPSRVRVVYNCANSSLFYNSLEKKKDKLRIVYLSNLMLEKGILDLLDACLLLKQSDIPFELNIAGKLEKGMENIVKQKIREIGNSCNYLGIVTGKSKNDLLFGSNIFCLPTYYNQEGQPISIIEAMASKNIVLTTKHAGIPDIFDEKSGFFIEKQNPSDLYSKLSFISENLEKHILKFGKYNFEKALSQFSEEKFTNSLLSIFNELSKSK